MGEHSGVIRAQEDYTTSEIHVPWPREVEICYNILRDVGPTIKYVKTPWLVLQAN